MKILNTCFKKIDKERAKSLGIKYTKLSARAIIGTAILYDVNEYKVEAEFEQDKKKHYADIKKFCSYKYGFIVKNAHRFGTPLPYPGRLRFFEVEYPAIP